MDDPTAKVSAILVNSNGTSEAASGVVQRYGQFWIEQVPISVRETNTPVLTVTDVVGKSTVTSISFLKSDLVLTVDQLSDNQLHLPRTTVTGKSRLESSRNG